ncbi:MAG: hypothetical protein DRR06_05550 [Gammaproteobacteria bacterium]|nr:MAG: hypothetical protein DRR06_05550 [Gammaproteobacteria bacterium]RLA52034.1 MAG: hypothetical protein DRR42_08640 [Gammaproteobacteria bacterium]
MVALRQLNLLLMSIATIIATMGTVFSVQADFNVHTGQWEGDVSAQTFTEYCRGDLPADQQASFYAQLDLAEQALAAQKTTAAEAAMGKALSAVYRGGAESDISVKCLGEPAARRWLTTKLVIQRLAPQPGLYITAADRGKDGLIEIVSPQPAARFVQSFQTIEYIADRIETDRQYGAFILAQENAIEKACRDAIEPLTKQARQKHQSTLAAEDKAFTRPATEQETAALNAIDDAEEFTSVIAGVELNATTPKETLLAQLRVHESRELLREARIWNLKDYDDIQARPTSQRAQKRGEAMLAQANDTGLSPGTRDQFYEDAIGYYEFGHWNTQVTKAKSAKDAIQPALKAENERQQADREKAKEGLASRAEQIKQAQKEMMKTEAEKKSFKDEADALEAELDF